MNCLLCKSKNTKVFKEFKLEDLANIWKPYYDVNLIIKDKVLNLYGCNDCDLQFFDPKYAGDDSFYSELGKLDWYYNHPGKTEYDFVQNYFEDGTKVLDVGCGKAVLLEKTKAKIEYTGLELSTESYRHGQDNNVDILNETIQSHAENNKEKYDVVVSFQVLEHLSEVNTFIKSSVEVLKKGGLYIVAVPNNDSFIKNIPNYTFNLPPHHIILWRKKQLMMIPNYFKNLELVKFQKEDLQDVHLDSADLASKYWLYSKLKFKSIELIDLSSNYQGIIERINKVKDKSENRILSLFLKSKLKDGQSMIAVYKKI
jgi:2-polyprenyl-3-methyl-5-hydroxy-6-metoxy-1,4-benzoquinol methylase